MAMSSEKKCVIMFIAGLSLFAGTGIWKVMSHEMSRTEIVYVDSPEPENRDDTRENTASRPTASTKARPVSSALKSTVIASEPLYININTAASAELEKLSGIGPHIAAEIVAYRESHGNFRNIDEIKNVSGIGDVIFEGIRLYIYVDDPYYPTEPPHLAEPDEPATDEPLRLEDCAPIDLNSADKETLMLLPYVDEPIADSIIELREKLRGFNHVYELLIVEELSREQVGEILEYVYASEKTTEGEIQ